MALQDPLYPSSSGPAYPSNPISFIFLIPRCRPQYTFDVGSTCHVQSLFLLFLWLKHPSFIILCLPPVCEYFSEVIPSFLPFFFFLCCCPWHVGMWRVQGQGLNPHHHKDPSLCSDNVRFLTCCAARELPSLLSIFLSLSLFLPPFFPSRNIYYMSYMHQTLWPSCLFEGPWQVLSQWGWSKGMMKGREGGRALCKVRLEEQERPRHVLYSYWLLTA